NHHPLSSYAITERVYIDGQKYYDRLDDQKRMSELAREKETLANADRGERRAPSTTTDAASPRPREERGTTGTNGTNGSVQTPAASPRPRTATRGVVAITNAKIFPIARPAIDRGTIVMRDGIIEAVGANVTVPQGAQVIDAAGSEVYPGFIDASTPTGLSDPGAGGFSDA